MRRDAEADGIRAPASIRPTLARALPPFARPLIERLTQRSSARDVPTQHATTLTTNVRRCVVCGYAGRARQVVPGSDRTTLALALVGLLPALPYVIWRIARTHGVCARCGRRHLIAVGGESLADVAVPIPRHERAD